MNFASGYGISTSGSWYNLHVFVQNTFVVDGVHTPRSAIAASTTGQVNVTVPDSAVHYLTAFCPSTRDGAPHAFNVTLQANGQSRTYSVNEELAQNHIFQFAFTGNATLTVTRLGDSQEDAELQAIFLD